MSSMGASLITFTNDPARSQQRTNDLKNDIRTRLSRARDDSTSNIQELLEPDEFNRQFPIYGRSIDDIATLAWEAILTHKTSNSFPTESHLEIYADIGIKHFNFAYSSSGFEEPLEPSKIYFSPFNQH